MARFTINGVEYQSKLLDGVKQTLVAKRLLPAFWAASSVSSQLQAVEGVRPTFDQVAQALTPVTVALAKMTDDDVNYIFDECLSVTQRQMANGVGWVPVVQAGHIQDMSDGSFATRVQITWHVISENFADMFRAFGIDPSGLMPSGQV